MNSSKNIELPDPEIDALLREISSLKDKLRHARKDDARDRKQRAQWASHLGNKTFSRLIALLAKPAGPELFQRGTESLVMLTQAAYGAVALLDRETQLRESIMAGTPPTRSGSTETFLSQRLPLVKHVMDSQSPLLLDNAPQYLHSAGHAVGHPTFHMFLGVPIVHEEHVFGCVYICDRVGGEPFAEDDEVLATTFASTIALVLAQARDRTERRRAEQERELLSGLGLLLAGADTLDKIGNTVAESLQKLLPWDTYCLAIKRVGARRFDPVTKITHGAVYASGCSETDSDTEQLLQGEAILRERRLVAPVHGDADVLGMLEVARGAAPPYHEADLRLLQRVADAIGPALSRAHAESRNRVFLRLAHQLTMVTDATDAAREIVSAADELMGWDSCSVTLYYPDQGVGVSVLHVDIVEGEKSDVFGPYPIRQPSEMARRTMDQGPQLILRSDETTAVPGVQAFGDVSKRSASLMFVPLRIGQQSTGVFSIQSYTPNAYTPNDLQLLQALADLCAGALERTKPAEAHTHIEKHTRKSSSATSRSRAKGGTRKT